MVLSAKSGFALWGANLWVGHVGLILAFVVCSLAGPGPKITPSRTTENVINTGTENSSAFFDDKQHLSGARRRNASGKPGSDTALVP
jgi:hypothetical protein